MTEFYKGYKQHSLFNTLPKTCLLVSIFLAPAFYWKAGHSGIWFFRNSSELLAASKKMAFQITQDVALLECLYDTYAPALYGLLLKLSPDTTIAASILTTSFTTIHKELPGYDAQKGSIFSFMLRITIKECEKQLKTSVPLSFFVERKVNPASIGLRRKT